MGVMNNIIDDLDINFPSFEEIDQKNTYIFAYNISCVEAVYISHTLSGYISKHSGIGDSG